MKGTLLTPYTGKTLFLPTCPQLWRPLALHPCTQLAVVENDPAQHPARGGVRAVLRCSRMFHRKKRKEKTTHVSSPARSPAGFTRPRTHAHPPEHLVRFLLVLSGARLLVAAGGVWGGGPFVGSHHAGGEVGLHGLISGAERGRYKRALPLLHRTSPACKAC